MFDILLTTLVGNIVVEKFFRLIHNSTRNIALVRIFFKGSFTKVMNFAAADENSQIINKRKGGTRAEQKLWENQAKRRKETLKRNVFIINGNV